MSSFDSLRSVARQRAPSDHPGGGWIGEGAAGRVADTRPADGVDVEHPAVPQAHKGRIHLARQHGELVVARRLEIRARVGPGCEEAAILEETHALVNQSRVAHKVGESSWLRREDGHCQSSTQG
jgi:hypothetical protein